MDFRNVILLLIMNINYFKHSKCFQFKYQVKFFTIKRCLSDNLFKTLGNPLKRKRRPPVRLVNESRIAERICITVIGNGGIGQPRCIGLFTDLKSYFFNCGEGVGRFCREYDIHIPDVKHIFITQKKWENLSGVADILLTNQAFGVPQMSIHGPSGIEQFRDVLLAEQTSLMNLNVKDASNEFFVDHSLKVDYVPIFVENRSLKNLKNASFKNAQPDVVFSYICQIFEKPGSFLVEKCVEYEVPLGPELLKLKNWEPVHLPSGKTVHPEDVFSMPFPGTTILVVDCPSEPFLEAFSKERKFELCQLPHSGAAKVSSVFHFTPPHIFSSSKYQDWIRRFHEDTQHFVLNSDNSTASSLAIYKAQKYFQMLHNDIFGKLKQVKEHTSFIASETPKIMRPPPLLQIHLRPENKFSWTNVVDLVNGNEEDGTEPFKSSPEFYAMLDQLKHVLKEPGLKVNNTTYPEVVFLGTSSSTSTGHRNVSAILVNTSQHESILLDCGEGAMMQFSRYYGAGVFQALRKIACIFVSHKHVDHYMGLFQLISERTKAFKILGVPYQPVTLILPHAVEKIFREFSIKFENLFPAVRIYNCSYLGKKRGHMKPFLNGIELLTVPVMHCLDAHGVVLQLGSDWKIVYSGDAAPSQKLIDAGRDCTVLIHEASIEDGLVNEALLKKHSTPSQVIDIAEKMNAKYVIMTHFSKRYLALPVLPDCKGRHIAAAFDFMKVQMCDWPLLPLFTPVIKCLFQEQLQSHSERTSSVVNFEKTFLKVLRS